MLDTRFWLLFLSHAAKGPIPFRSVTGGGDGPAHNH